MVQLSLAMVVGVAPALVSWWRGGIWMREVPLVPQKRQWGPRRSPSLSDCLASSSDEESARSVVCQVRPKIVSFVIVVRFQHIYD